MDETNSVVLLLMHAHSFVTRGWEQVRQYWINWVQKVETTRPIFAKYCRINCCWKKAWVSLLNVLGTQRIYRFFPLQVGWLDIVYSINRTERSIHCKHGPFINWKRISLAYDAVWKSEWLWVVANSKWLVWCSVFIVWRIALKGAWITVQG